RDRAAGTVVYGAGGEGYPLAAGRVVDWIVAGPVLHCVLHGKRRGPCNAGRIDGFGAAETKQHPLRMGRIRIAGKGSSQIRIAFPEGGEVAIVEAEIRDL